MTDDDTTTTGPDFWELLDDPPYGCNEVAQLFHWSTNFPAGTGPATLFLDLIGWSHEEMGAPIFSMEDPALGYLELDKLARALLEYATNPWKVKRYVSKLVEAESR